MDRQGAIDQVKLVGSFDVPSGDTTLGGWVDIAVEAMGVESEWTKAVVELGPSVANQAAYTLPVSVQRVLDVITAGAPATRIGWEELEAQKAGTREIVGVGSLFAPQFGSDGTRKIEFWPSFDSAGATIQALCVISPSGIAAIPTRFHMGIVHRAIAEGLSLTEEDDDRAAWHIDYFEREKEKLRRLANSQLTSSTQTAPIAGLHF